MDISIPEELRGKIPQLGEASAQADPMVWLKFTCAEAGWSWYVVEFEPIGQDALLYGYTVGWNEDVGYFHQSDLDYKSAQWGFPILQDETFTPCPLSEVQARERGERKFPLGRIVATPGAVEALARNNHSAAEFLRRHWRGDWGEVDPSDREENEYSLAKGLRLLSVYTLADGTRIWIITEADRSASTVLLPEEY